MTNLEYNYKKYLFLLLSEVKDCDYPVEFAQQLRNLFIISYNVLPEDVNRMLMKKLDKKNKLC